MHKGRERKGGMGRAGGFRRRLPGIAAVALLALAVGLGGIAGGFGLGSIPSLLIPEAAAAGSAEEGLIFAGEGLRVTAFFFPERVRLVFSDGREKELPQQVSASGARYTDGDTLFWTKGDEAWVQWDGKERRVRLATAENDGWLRARAEGVAFRAVGQEPGWTLEVYDGEKLSLLLDYGATTLTVPLGEQSVDFARGVRRYGAGPPLAPVRVAVTVVSRPCYDVMSGEGFTAAVTVELPDTGVTYTGCGRDL